MTADEPREADICRVVEVPTPGGETMPVRIHGGAEPSEEGRAALGQLVAAAAKRSAIDNPHGAVIQELMLVSLRARAALHAAGAGDLADRLSAAIRAARDLIAGPVTR